MSKSMAQLILTICCLGWGSGVSAEQPHEDKDGNFHVPAVALPPSPLLSEETRTIFKLQREESAARAKAGASCGDLVKATAEQAPAIRKCEVEKYIKSPEYARLNAMFPVTMAPQMMGSVYTEVFTPKSGIAPDNAHRVLINVHGGGFIGGSRTGSHMESLPISALARIKVVSIDYRMAPEYKFPAASEDVEAVYKELLKQYKPEQIGIYGCSAGGMLAAQSVAWFLDKKLPRPGAVGMFCNGGAYWMEGDSGQPWKGRELWGASDNPYFSEVDPDRPLAFPVRSKATLAQFPPSLLIAGTRDFALSSIANTHSRLVAAGVDADLHVWEGLGHGFFMDPRLPESREAYDVIVKFFDRHLSR